MRISDWSSDVCSSDLGGRLLTKESQSSPVQAGEDLFALDAGAIAERLSGSPEGRAAFVRAAAEAGVAEAQAVYGQILLDGAGVAVDQRAALEWFSKADAQHQDRKSTRLNSNT